MRDLKSPHPEIRRQACFALGAIGNSAEQAVPALAVLLTEDPAPQVRADAALALSKMSPASRLAVSALADALEDEAPAVRINAVLALIVLKEKARPAVPALIQALQDHRNRTGAGMFLFTIQEGAAIALGRASDGSEEAVGVLMATVKSTDYLPLRLAAIRALGEIGAAAQPAVPLLRPLLDDKSPDIHRAVEEALQKIGEKNS
jgi:HEAT repeat protein